MVVTILLGASKESLIFLCLREKFGYPADGLLYKAKIYSEGRLDGFKSQVQHGGQLSNSQLPVFLHGGGESSHNVIGPLGFYRDGVALIRGRFPLLHSFYFFLAFSSPGEQQRNPGLSS
jgi:hypothetical protein